MEFIPKTVPHGFTQHTKAEQTASHSREARLMGARLMTDIGEVPSDLTYDLIKIGKGTCRREHGTEGMDHAQYGAAKAEMDPS